MGLAVGRVAVVRPRDVASLTSPLDQAGIFTAKIAPSANPSQFASRLPSTPNQQQRASPGAYSAIFPLSPIARLVDGKTPTQKSFASQSVARHRYLRRKGFRPTPNSCGCVAGCWLCERRNTEPLPQRRAACQGVLGGGLGDGSEVIAVNDQCPDFTALVFCKRAFGYSLV